MTYDYLKMLEFDYLKNRKRFRIEKKSIFLVSQVLFRHTKQTSKNVTSTTCKRKGTTGKVESSLLQEEKLWYQREISRFRPAHHIPFDLILNIDQTSLTFVPTDK